jgi:hypothetical protein
MSVTTAHHHSIHPFLAKQFPKPIMPTGFVEYRAFNIQRVRQIILHQKGLAPMEYTLYIILGTLLAGLALYHLWKTRKRPNRFELPASPDTIPPLDDYFDNFICFMRSDGSTFPGFAPREERDT